MAPGLLVSACLLGAACRYDGGSRLDPEVLAALAGRRVVPVCPEQLGGLATPRPAAALEGGDGLAVIEGRAAVRTVAGQDVTAQFLRGAEEAARLARRLGVARAVLKARSPSCGLTPVLGVTAARLLLEGLEIEEAG
ncbi:DUF523 domain-containing protein [Dissulfurirhabdus thermomarina]|uniref:DUF523 domain-containing protein n=1 Tax=Dissulfurirhabdus thermomarina TaxID=1765737 RepID=A0A6N9TNG2_DISTH|nr:DUF523 domain-containing protein [Dissulfurirhabdus thermomarina]NMX22807.1 DUF523 domain-containing protein [Dissulfurirhabdus thermomarina]